MTCDCSWNFGPLVCRGITNLCISDVFKQLLLNNPTFIPLLIDGLLLDPEHPHKASGEDVKAVVQRDFAECIQQLSLFQPGADALQANPTVVDALDTLVSRAWSEGARECAKGCLMQLCPERSEVVKLGRGFPSFFSNFNRKMQKLPLFRAF